MNKILLNKIKKALDSDFPIETIHEIVSEYDDLYRLYLWRKETIERGEHLERYEDEIVSVGKLLTKHGFVPYTKDESIVVELKKFFNKL